MASGHPHDEDVAPLETTPQGTQEEGVEQGHEERDVNLRAILGWFAALGAVVVVVVLLLWGVFEMWARSAPKEDLPPSPVFAREPHYPAPLILPGPPQPGVESLAEALSHSPEAMMAERRNEAKAAFDAGLQDDKGNPIIPPAAAEKVMAEQKGPRPTG